MSLGAAMGDGKSGAVLEAHHLAKRFGGVTAVADVSFAIAASERLALIGPNGAGKTTCFNLINGQLRADAGEVMLAGEPILGLAPRVIWRRGVGRTFQVTATFGSMSVRENVQMALLSHRRALADFWRPAARCCRSEADALLERVGMRDQAQRAASILSYGDLKRLELAIALANEPRLLLMDEPTAGMAPRERIALMDLVSAIVRERRIAVLFTEHDMDVVFRHADRVLVMDRGRVIAQGSVDEVRANEQVQRIYLGSRH